VSRRNVQSIPLAPMRSSVAEWSGRERKGNAARRTAPASSYDTVTPVQPGSTRAHDGSQTGRPLRDTVSGQETSHPAADVSPCSRGRHRDRRGTVGVVSPPEPFPAWFFRREDPSSDAAFYGPPRLVNHIDDGAIAAVGDLYAELGVDGSADTPRRVLDLMSSWVSHLRSAPAELVVLGMNAAELAANPMATERIVQDLNVEPALPFDAAGFDAVLCCVSVDYLVRPVEVLREAARVLRPGAPLVLTFSNRCFPTKAVHGWLAADDAGRCAIVADYVRRAGGFSEPQVSLRTPERDPAGRPYRGDPLHAAVARASSGVINSRAQPDR